MASAGSPTIWIIGSRQMHLRIPLLHRLHDDGFSVAAVGPGPGSQLTAAGFTFHRVPLAGKLSPLDDLRARSALVELFREHRPDLVHSINTKPSILVPAAARTAGISACIRSITGLGSLFSSHAPTSLALRCVYRFLQRRASQDCQLTVFQNPDDQQYFLDNHLVAPGTDRLVLSSGIDVESFVALSGTPTSRAALRDELGLTDGPVIAMVSSLSRSEGIAEYLDAARLVRERDPRVTCLLIASEIHEDRSSIPVDLVRGCPHVRFVGPGSDVPGLLAISDLFVFPTYLQEGVPRVLLEAGSIGLPLVTTDMPGCREAVRHGENGVLVTPRDAPALAHTVTDLLADPARRRRMGQASRDLVANTFHLNTVAAAYADIYREALGITRTAVDNPVRNAA